MILSCFRCADNSGAGAKFQDKTFGDGKRVHNERAKSGTGPIEYRCTVCETSRSAKRGS
jgi:hypothetical protein